MDSFTRAAQFAASQGDPNADSCLKSSALCFNTLSKCVSGPCKPRQRAFMREARARCASVHERVLEESEKPCLAPCAGSVLGRGASAAQAQRVLGGEDAGLDEERVRRLRQCMRECKTKRAFDSAAYGNCVNDALEDQVMACTKASCLADIEACRAKRCGKASP